MTVPAPSPDPANRLPCSPCQDLPDTPAQPPPGLLPQPAGDPLAANATDQPTIAKPAAEPPRWQRPVRGRRPQSGRAPVSPDPEQRLRVLDAVNASGDAQRAAVRHAEASSRRLGASVDGHWTGGRTRPFALPVCLPRTSCPIPCNDTSDVRSVSTSTVC